MNSCDCSKEEDLHMYYVLLRHQRGSFPHCYIKEEDLYSEVLFQYSLVTDLLLMAVFGYQKSALA